MNYRDEIAHMIRMENAVDYMETHIRQRITVEEVARSEGVMMNPAYFGKIFAEYYDIPFREYFVMLRMRDAARLIKRTHDYRNIGKLYGYSDVKSFRDSFEREIGCSPREFARGLKRVPDMPARKQLAGVPFSFAYAELRDIALQGVHLYASEGTSFDRLNDAGYAQTCPEEWKEKMPGHSSLYGGVWTINQEGKETYYIGEADRNPIIFLYGSQPSDKDEEQTWAGAYAYAGFPKEIENESGEGVSGGMEYPADYRGLDWRQIGEIYQQTKNLGSVESPAGQGGQSAGEEEKDPQIRNRDSIEIDGGHYALFVARKGDDDDKNVMVARMMARYAFFEWQKINRKEINHMGFTFEMFDDHHMYLFLPLMGKYGSDNRFRENMQVAKFRHYIDQHIKEEIDIGQYAKKIHYSERWLRDTFQDIYHVSPQRYIDDKRMRLVLSRIREGYQGRKADLVAEYQYATLPAFSRKFQNRFGMPWQEYILKESEASPHYLDPLYIDGDPEREILIEVENIPDMTLDVHPLYMEGTKMELHDYPGLVIYWFTHSYDVDYFGFPLQNTGKKEKIFIYGIGRSPGQGQEDTRYVIGEESRGQETPKGFKKRRIQGGRYICFSLKNPETVPNRLDQYQQIESTIFIDWYRNNELMVDTTKEKLIRYREGKLTFCLPMDV